MSLASSLPKSDCIGGNTPLLAALKAQPRKAGEASFFFLGRPISSWSV